MREVPLSPQPDHLGGLWPKDVVDQSCQRPQRVGLLIFVLVAIVDALDASHDMTEDSLGNLLIHAGTAHQCSRRPPKVMRLPMRQRACCLV